ncbi:galactokinase, partial [Salmonella enterica subsp. enterica serovar Typhimurium]
MLPCAIGYCTVIVARPRDDRRIRVVAADYDAAIDEYALDKPIERLAAPMWANYVRGVVRELLQREPLGHSFLGMDMVIA